MLAPLPLFAYHFVGILMGGLAMPEWVWAVLGFWIAASLIFGLVAWLHDGYVRLTTWRAGHRR